MDKRMIQWANHLEDCEVCYQLTPERCREGRFLQAQAIEAETEYLQDRGEFYYEIGRG